MDLEVSMSWKDLQKETILVEVVWKNPNLSLPSLLLSPSLRNPMSLNLHPSKRSSRR